ncbi:MAG: saccharopine dehydrogenase family protein [Methanothrix sp.]
MSSTQKKRIFILGGYGGAGSYIARLMLQETNADLTIAGRKKARADGLAQELNASFPGRIESEQADASDSTGLGRAFQDADMVIVASTTTNYVDAVAGAALDAGIDYLDIHYPKRCFSILSGLSDRIDESGQCFITQAGFVPGLPSLLVRLAASRFDDIEIATVGAAMNTRFEKGDALYEFMDSLSDYEADIFRNGKWEPASLIEFKSLDFGPHLGRKRCLPMNLVEMRSLPEMLGLQELGTYAAGMNWFVDWLVIPAAFTLGRIRKGLGREALASLMVWGLEKFSPSKEEAALVLQAEGKKDGKDIQLRAKVWHSDAYFLTASPVVACTRQYLNGSIKPGLNIMGHAVDAKLMIEDMVRMGIHVDSSLFSQL